MEPGGLTLYSQNMFTNSNNREGRDDDQTYIGVQGDRENTSRTARRSIGEWRISYISRGEFHTQLHALYVVA